jgi:hypothetical protein
VAAGEGVAVGTGVLVGVGVGLGVAEAGVVDTGVSALTADALDAGVRVCVVGAVVVMVVDTVAVAVTGAGQGGSTGVSAFQVQMSSRELAG